MTRKITTALNAEYQAIYDREITFFLDVSARAGDVIDDNEFDDYCTRKYEECLEDQMYAALSDEQWARIQSYRRTKIQWLGHNYRAECAIKGKGVVKPISRL